MQLYPVLRFSRRYCRSVFYLIVITAMMSLARGAEADRSVEQWGLYEITLRGPSDGNPFTEVELSARFTCQNREIDVDGFYDGDGIYRIRFMPDIASEWSYKTKSNRQELDAQTGTFRATIPSAGNHGPVRVRNMFHFAYADGTPYFPIGTTCYAWTHQDNSLQEQTLATLRESPFNKLRMCVFPKRYAFNQNEPPHYPFVGTPPRDWDVTRFNPEFFRALERRVRQLLERGIEADLILFHPYDKGHWGFDRLPAEVDDRYLKYVIARLAAHRNVWWSLANEFDFMTEKKDSDWDRLLQLVADCDPYGHLRSIHNGTRIYNHNQPWVTHASIQNGSAVADFGRAVLYRDVYRKPIVLDEVKYEGNIEQRWGNIDAQEMVHRFWQGAIAGTYAGHGETFRRDDDVLWWSKGGVLRGESPKRIAFLRQVLESGPANGLDPIDKWQDVRTAGQRGEYYLIYFGKEKPTEWLFAIPAAGLTRPTKFQVEILDTWNMTITPVKGTFEARQRSQYIYACESAPPIPLPGQPYMALRIHRVP